MYQAIGQKIKTGDRGDSIRSLLSTELSIYMEEDFQLQSRKMKLHWKENYETNNTIF